MIGAAAAPPTALLTASAAGAKLTSGSSISCPAISCSPRTRTTAGLVANLLWLRGSLVRRAERREVLGARFTSGLAPACAELDAVGGDPVVRRLGSSQGEARCSRTLNSVLRRRRGGHRLPRIRARRVRA